MINQWSISNFKSIRERIDLGFAPLTLFVGQNSAGKSTLIQSILMTAQTLQSNATSRSVILNGRILRLGEFSDIRSNESRDNAVSIGFEIGKSPYASGTNYSSSRSRVYYAADFHNQMRYVCCSYTFSAGIGPTVNRVLQLQPQIEKGGVAFVARDSKDNFSFDFKRVNEPQGVLLHKLSVLPENVRLPDLAALDFNIAQSSGEEKSYRNYRMSAQTAPAGVVLRHFLPVSVGAVYDAVEVEVNAMFDHLIDGSPRFAVGPGFGADSVQIFDSVVLKEILVEAAEACVDLYAEYAKSRILRAIEGLRHSFSFESLANLHSVLTPHARKNFSIQLTGRENDIKHILRFGRKARKEISAFPVADPVIFASDYITTFFSERVKYLGPLRDEPKAIYPLAGYNDPKDIGYRGEYTAAVLDNNKKVLISYLPSDLFPSLKKADLRPINRSLVEAVRDWLEYLGIASKVATQDKGKLGHEMTIATSESAGWHDLTHVGVGVSQALPIVVTSLLAESGSTLIFEQPELHLHPRVQTRLADFFMSLILMGKQCIVETHSEYLISRLRYLTSISRDVDVASNIKIYFVEKPGHQSQYNEVRILETGALSSWPEGFFDESEKNATAIVQAQIERAKNRRKVRVNGGNLGD